MLKTKQLTADDLAQMPDREERTELVKGELRTMAPAGHRHGIVAMKTVYRSLQDIFVLTEEDVLEGDDLLPGFTVEVREILA